MNAEREQTIAEFKRILAKKEAARQGTLRESLEMYVVYTGPYRVWVNMEAARKGQVSISLEHATKYRDERNAMRDAVRVKNGNNERGQVCTVCDAYDWEIENLTQVIHSLEKL